MKKALIIGFILLFVNGLFAQAPNKISYQAIIRNASNALVANQTVGMRISILQNSPSGTSVYVETHSPTSNANGLVSIEIGGGLVVSGSFATINWSDGPYFVKTETDPSGGNSYSIIGIMQLLSVPYALHANTAESLTEPIIETDPKFAASLAKGITSADTSKWNQKLETFFETDPQFSSSVAKGITSVDTSKWNQKLDAYFETDPQFSSSLAKGITSADTSKWNQKLDTYLETDPQFSSSLANGITSADTSLWNHKLDSFSELDPIFLSSVASSISISDTLIWNNKQDKLIAGQGITISANTIQSTGGFSHYIGEPFGGGVIFHLWKTAGVEHGLIVALTDQSQAAAWSSVTNLLIGTTAQSTWDGLTNSNAIYGQSGSNSIAAAICLNLVNGGQSDWYLPSIDELNLLWQNRFDVNKSLGSLSGANALSLARYWSSNENNLSTAWYFYFNGGLSYNYSTKSNMYCVRAIRSF
ncbi:MAG: DUF1566 domain-containing protein [Bacteroidia bacterium]|nr:DUF1566 domain-containing protein [Bacteroidia bacterium]